MNNNVKKKSVSKSIVKNVIALLIFFAIPFFAYRSCTSGYDKYAFFVQVNDGAIFETRLDPSDARIIDRGRKLKDEIIMMDKEIDSGDGANAGKLRWYVCSGIDCDEGWERSFLTGK
ncbi:MAG: hypothetical protein GY797_20475 [Deltaproteobacteria bacterium]|nr:hypothetical protein [Deltaproteobacteria bacterium]